MKILIADDFEAMRGGVESLLDGEPDMDVVGQAEDGRIAVQLAHELRPDVIVMDIEMPNLNGIEATQQIVQKLPGIKVIAFSSRLDSGSVREMFRAGASGYVSKQCPGQELISAIKTVALNQTYLSPKITSVVVDGYTHRSPQDDTSPYSLLTTKEREVLQLIAEGKTTKIIAGELNISIKAVEWRRGKIMRKLNMRSVVDLIKYAVREGIIGVYA